MHTQNVAPAYDRLAVAKARQRVADGKLSHAGRPELMNAKLLAFPESSLDVTVAQYVISSVPSPGRVLSELARVVRPGGEIIVTSRIGVGHGMWSAIEHWLMPVTSRPGWWTGLWRRYTDSAANMPGITLLEYQQLRLWGISCSSATASTSVQWPGRANETPRKEQ